MDYKKIENTYVLVLERKEEILTCLNQFCEKEKVFTAKIEGLGACDHVNISVYDVEKQVFHRKDFDQPFEITSLIGNISTMDGRPYLHLHITLADENLHCFGGHLNECVISATAELYVTVLNGTVERKKDPETGFNLFDFN